MIDTLTNDSWEDFSRRYNHTYCWLLRGQEKLFVFIEDITPDAVKFSCGGNMSFSARADTDTKFEFIPVDRGWYNTSDGSILHLSRVPERQWRRGISNGNTVAHDAALFPVDLTYKRLASVFNHANPRAFDLRNSHALSKHFAWSANKEGLFFHHALIGTAQDGDKFMVDHQFVQEVTDAVRRAKINMGVIGR